MDATTRPSPLAGRAKQIGKTKHTTCVSMLGRQVQASGGTELVVLLLLPLLLLLR